MSVNERFAGSTSGVLACVINQMFFEPSTVVASAASLVTGLLMKIA